MDNLCYNESIGPEKGKLLTTRGGGESRRTL